MSYRYYLQKLQSQTFLVTVHRIFRKIFKLFKGLFGAIKAYLFTTTISDEELLKSMNPPFRDIDSVIRNLRQGNRSIFFTDFIKSPDLLDIIKKCYPESISTTLTDADKICEHIFDILGSGPVYLGEKIDWHRDFKGNWHWKPRYYELILSLHLDKSYDMKVPWELSRCHHFATLGKAYLYTKDEKYAAEFVNQVSDWIESNPPKYGVNWLTTMEVAIRITNWIWGYHFFIDSPTFTDDFLLKFIKSILAHGRYIMDNLENKSAIPNNHYLSNLVGLVYLGFLFTEFKEAEEWRNFGIRNLINEVGKQFYSDGANFEGTISYHRLSTGLVTFATAIILLNTQKSNQSTLGENNWNDLLKSSNTFPEWYLNRLERMFDFVLYYTKFDGTAPQIGDSDDGRMHILSNYGNWDKLDHRYLLSVGAILFDRADLKKGAAKFHEEAFWIFGKSGLNSFNLISTEAPELESKAFSQSGFYMMRHEDLYMIVDCILNDPNAFPGHRHNSRLSFELSAYGRNFIVDAGTYIYTADLKWRNAFRSTEYHNTIQIDEKEQNEIDPTTVFWIGNQAHIKINNWENTRKYDFLDVQHSGYKRLSDPLTHRRQIFFNKTHKYWLIRDMLTSENHDSLGKIHKFDFNLHFAPMKVMASPELPLSIIAQDSQGVGLAVIPIKYDALTPPDIKQGWLSYSYGVKIEAPMVKYSKSDISPVEFLFLFYPYKRAKLDINIDQIESMIPSFMKGGF